MQGYSRSTRWVSARMELVEHTMKAPRRAKRRSSAESFLSARNALTKTVESSTTRRGSGMLLFSEVLDPGSDLLLLFLGALLAVMLAVFDTLHRTKYLVPGSFSLDHGYRLEENAFLHSLGLQVIAFGQVKALA